MTDNSAHEVLPMRVRYAVTFEFMNLPPLTHRGEVDGGSAATCVHRATRDAQRVLKPKRWSSMNCVLLERLAETDSESAIGDADADIADEDDESAT